MDKRQIDLCVISDVHLGTYGCHADELVDYLRQLNPKVLVLNGDIFDIWQFRKRYFPNSHLRVLREILKKASDGCQVYYITGNHDDLLRRFVPFSMGNFHLKNKLVLELRDKKAWFFHGDVFDSSINHARWLAKLGGWGYDFLILLNRAINSVLQRFGRPPKSFSKKIKKSVKKAVKFIDDFETTAMELAIENGYDYVVCGHIHQPQKRKYSKNGQHTMYLNSGDWVEHLSALEYDDGKWRLYDYERAHALKKVKQRNADPIIRELAV